MGIESAAAPRASRNLSGFDVEAIRADFPILARPVHGRPLVYFDNAATAQKPRPVLDALLDFYTGSNANIHRGVHSLSEAATAAYESARDDLSRFLGAASADEIVFLRGTTEAINLVAQGWARPRLGPGDRVLVTVMEHHSNFVPWQRVSEQTGAALDVLPITPEGDLDLESLGRMLTPRTRIVACTHVSNSLGTVNPVAEIAALAHQAGAVLVLDAAQSVPHLPVNVQALGCDFLACSGHKMMGPLGIGVLYGRRELLEKMEPWQTGGGMIQRVRAERTTYASPPGRFEAGTPAVADAVGLAAAARYLERIGFDAIEKYESGLVEAAAGVLGEIAGLRVVGSPAHRTGVISVVLDGLHPHDIATVLDQDGVAVRAGHHCNQPLMDFLGVPGTVRISFAFYNTLVEIETLAASLHRVRRILG